MRTFNTVFLAVVFISALSVSAHAQEAGKPEAAPKTRVLIVDDETTGYYLWAGTAPLLKKTLNDSKRVEAVIVEDAETLGTDVVFDYDVLLLHFKNYKTLKRDAQVKKNLATFVRDGGGLFVYHFACGAFEDWPEYEKLSGRVWDPKLPAHDPYGKFTVNIVDRDHPITEGVEDFETQDELYTCLRKSEVPIHVLVEATSKVDGKKYPMAFVLDYGKGRVFHTTLGHDAPSVTSPAFVRLLNNAVSWLAEKR